MERPTDPRIPGTVSTRLVVQKVAAMSALGLDTERILGLAGLPRDRLTDPHGRLPADASYAFWDAAIRVSRDPAIGLRVGALLETGGLGSYEYLLRNSETLRQVVDRADRYMRLVDDTARLEVRERDATATLRIYRAGGYSSVPADVEALFAAALSLLRKQAPTLGALAVRFTSAAPADVAIYRRHFGCAVYFECEHDEMEFPLAILHERAAGADPALGLVLEEYAQHLISQLPAMDSLVTTARGKLLEEIKRGAPTPASLARAMHMSERTLRRRLQAEGTSYQGLLEGLRAELARHYVANTREAFDVIAGRLAFGDASAFFRSFKRWTGTTPAQFRGRGRTATDRTVGRRQQGAR